MEQIKIYWRILRRGWWIILLTTVVAAAAAALITASRPSIYQSSARYIVSPNAELFEDSDLVRRSLDTLDNSEILTTYAEVFSSPRMKREGANTLGWAEGEAGNYGITAVNLPQTKIIQLTVRGENPQQVMALTEAIGNASSIYMQDLYEIYKISQLDPASVPSAPINENPLRNAVVAGILGFAIGVGLAFVYGYLRQEEDSTDVHTRSVPV